MDANGAGFLGVPVGTWTTLAVVASAVIGFVGIFLHGWAFWGWCSQKWTAWRSRLAERREMERGKLAEEVWLERWPAQRSIDAVSFGHAGGEHGFHLSIMKEESTPPSEFVGKVEWRNPGPREVSFRVVGIEIRFPDGKTLELQHVEQVFLPPESIVTMPNYLRIRLQPTEETILAKGIANTIRPAAGCGAIHPIDAVMFMKLETVKEHNRKIIGHRTMIAVQDFRK